MLVIATCQARVLSHCKSQNLQAIKKYLNEYFDSTFVSSVGKFVDDFEKN
jgi:hypothetical protein